MLQRISPIYASSEIEKSICEAIGSEWDSVNELIDEVLLQLFPQTATWGLVFWEQRFNLSTNLNENIELRRAKVISKMQTKYPITPLTMANILKKYTGADIIINENIAPYTFEIKLTGKQGFPKSLEALYNTVNKIKPSHLSVKYTLITESNMSIYFASAMCTGEEIIVYPWTPKEIESKCNAYVALGTNTGSESITVYPKEAI